MTMNLINDSNVDSCPTKDGLVSRSGRQSDGGAWIWNFVSIVDSDGKGTWEILSI